MKANTRVILLSLAVAIFLATTGCTTHSSPRDTGLAAEDRALQLLAREVPAWPAENGCFSCHNNGDAARALYVASARDDRIPVQALATTTAWLAKPDGWDNNKGDPGFSDPRLANLQFALAALAATEAGQLKDRQPLHDAGLRIRGDQAMDGSWPIDIANPVGSPATYGQTLATALAIRVLRASALNEPDDVQKRASEWLGRAAIFNTPAAAAVMLADSSSDRIRQGMDFLFATQNSDGGWGPYPDAPSEPYDTALALLGLAQVRQAEDSRSAILRGRAFLITWQNTDGSWQATTRPPGGESYAQQMSTTGWATLALLVTADIEKQKSRLNSDINGR